jgi:hypothetical protein
VLAAALVLPAGVQAAQEPLPALLDVVPPPAGLPAPDELIGEARQLVAGQSGGHQSGAAALVEALQGALALQQALATVDGRRWPVAVPGPVQLAESLDQPAALAAARRERERYLLALAALAARQPEEALRLLARIPPELEAGDGSLRSMAALRAAAAVAAADPRPAGRLAEAIPEEAIRGAAWEQIGRAWLRVGAWDRALEALAAATGDGRMALFGEMARQASGSQLDQLGALATTAELRLALVVGIADRQPELAWRNCPSLRGTPFFFTAAAYSAAAMARTNPARALEALEAGASAWPATDAPPLPAPESLALAFARVDRQRALAVASQLAAAGERAPPAVDESLGQLAAAVAAYDRPRAAALLGLVHDPVRRESAWEAAGAAASDTGTREVEALAVLAPDPASAARCLAGGARALGARDPAAAFALGLAIQEPVTRAAALTVAAPGPTGPTLGELVGALMSAARDLMADSRRDGARDALAAVARRLAVLDRAAIAALLAGLRDRSPWLLLLANSVGPVDPALAESLSPEIGRYWRLQATLREVQALADRDPPAALRLVERSLAGVPRRWSDCFRSHALATAGRALALTDPEAALQLIPQITEPDERAQYLVELGSRLSAVQFPALVDAARSLPAGEARAAALSGLAVALEGHRQAGARAAAARDGTDPVASLGEGQAAVFFAPELAETHYNLARLLEKSGQAREAAAHYLRFRELRPGSPLAAALAPPPSPMPDP